MTFIDVFGLSAVTMVAIGLILAIGVLWLDRHWGKLEEKDYEDYDAEHFSNNAPDKPRKSRL